MQITDSPEQLLVLPERTAMYAEARESASIVRRQLEKNRSTVSEIAIALKRENPRFILTCARGSSDHAATFFKYLVESRLGLSTASAAPSIQSVYKSRQYLADALFVAITQSGVSPDLIENVRRARLAGAKILIFVNDTQSPIADLADFLIPLHAGTENSVAATKSYVATLAAMTQLVAEWSGDRALREGLSTLADGLDQAWEIDWQDAVDLLADANNLFVIGRGLGLGIAQEAALKLKETCGLHAEAVSAAEVRHGPMALIRDGFPVLVLAQQDETRPGVDELVASFRAQGASVLVTGATGLPGLTLPTVRGFDAAIQPILLIQSFYRMCVSLSLIRGRDPDRPPNISKLTRTL